MEEFAENHGKRKNQRFSISSETLGEWVGMNSQKVRTLLFARGRSIKNSDHVWEFIKENRREG